jgi:hypothetical protein
MTQTQPQTLDLMPLLRLESTRRKKLLLQMDLETSSQQIYQRMKVPKEMLRPQTKEETNEEAHHLRRGGSPADAGLPKS